MQLTPGDASISARQCNECSRDMVKAHKVHAGTALCQSCYQRLFKRRSCVQCGGSTRALAHDPEPTCSTCKRAVRVCLRCERPVPVAALIFKGKAVCPSCAPYYREARPCPRCGKSSTALSRIVGVTDDAVCEACRRKLLCATCSVCGKHRDRYALTAEGKPLCKTCAAAPDATHACPDCEIVVGGMGAEPCLPCALIRSLRAKESKLVGIFIGSETAILFRDFVEWAIARKATSKILRRLPLIADILGRLERSRGGGSLLGSDAIRSGLTTEEIRQSGLFGMFLAERGLLVDSAARRAELSDLRRIDATLAEVTAKPWGKLVKQYADVLASEKRKLSSRTRRVYLRAAAELMTSSKVARIEDLTDEHVRKFVRARPGHRASLFPWLTFLRENTGRSFLVPKAQRRKDPTIRSMAIEVGGLLTAIQSTTSKKARRALTAKLLALTYGVPLEQILSLDLAKVDLADGRVRAMFDDDWIAIQAPVAELVAELATDSEERSPTTGKLFPGRFAGDSLSVGAVDHFLRSVGA